MRRALCDCNSQPNLLSCSASMCNGHCILMEPGYSCTNGASVSTWTDDLHLPIPFD